MEPDLDTDLFRFAVALAIGAFVGLERQARLERPPAGPEEGAEAPEGGVEAQVRSAVAASEASRGEAPPTAAAPAPAAAAVASDSWIPDFQQAAGFRTFSLVALLGAIAAHFGTPWVFVIGFLMVGLLIGTSYVASVRRHGDMGLTSEVAVLTVYLLGGLCTRGETGLAAASAFVIVGLLSVKKRLHGFARRISNEDMNALLKFALLTLVILPVLPNEPIPIGRHLPGVEAEASADVGRQEAGSGEGVVRFAPPEAEADPDDRREEAPGAPARPGSAAADGQAPTPDAPWWAGLTIDPRKIWFMVILISGISFAGYALGKVVGAERGIVITGLVGGLASSTAVSLTYSQRSLVAPELAPQFGIGILLANALMPVRLLIVLGLVAPPLLKPLALPLLATAGVGGAAALAIHLRRRGARGEAEVKLKNPFEIGPALKFGLLFGAVLFAAQIVQALFGRAGLYGLAVVTGLTDVDAIGLAIAEMVRQEDLPLLTAATTVTLGVISNTVLKGGLVVATGHRDLRWLAVISFGLMLLAAGAGLGALWVLAGRA